MKIYNRLGLFRAERGQSRKELAEAVGVNPQTIGYIERGDYNCSLELAIKLATELGVPLDALFSAQPFEPVASLLQRAKETS